jgi:hypothetical protein
VVYRLLTSESGRQWADTQCRGDAMFVESGVGWERTRFWGQCTGTSSATWCTLDPSVATAHRPTPQRHASEHSLISPRGPTAARTSQGPAWEPGRTVKSIELVLVAWNTHAPGVPEPRFIAVS